MNPSAADAVTESTAASTMGALVGLLALGAVLVAWLPLPQWAAGLAGYTPLHTLLETVAVVTAMLVFAIVWHAPARDLPAPLVALACAFLGVALLDFSHLLSFPGMPDFVTPSGTEKAIGFWLAARALAAVALLAVALAPWRPLDSGATRYLTLAAVLAVTALAHGLFLFHPGWIPRTFVAGAGLTAFKTGAEYALIALYLAAALCLSARRFVAKPIDAPWLTGAALASALSEFLFTRYGRHDDLYNLLGHLYKLAAYLFLYRALFTKTITLPYRRLKAAEELIERSNRELEGRVIERTRELQQANERLERARDAADAASRAKSDFLATMSHEIRTPMNGVIGLVEVLRRSSLRPSQIELVDTIAESADALLGIIDDILDFSKIEAGKLQLEAHPFAIEHEVQAVCATFDAAARDKGVELIAFIDPALDVPVLGDAKRLRQVLLNLVSNAIKFSTGRTRARVHLAAAGRGNGGLRVRFGVTDTGIGMSPETLANLFQPFTQADTGTARRFGGSGLGLSISQRLVTMMGGSIEVQSTPDAGSRFGFTLTFALAEAAPHRLPPVDLAGLDIQVISADRELAAMLRSYLEAAGARACMLAPGESADPARAGSAPVLRVLDVGEEPVDAAALAALHAGGQRTVLLGRGQRRRPRMFAPGVAGVDANCLRRRALLDAVAAVAGRISIGPDDELSDTDEDTQRHVPTLAEAGERGSLILVAEDNEINRQVIVRQLRLLGYAAELTCNGREALDRWRASPRRYGLLLTDLHMPELDGRDLTVAIRARDEGHLPIVALTADAMGGEAQRCLDAGMDGVLVKPVSLERLEETVRLWLPAAAQGIPDKSTGPASTPAPDTPSAAPLNVAALAALVGEDRTVIDELLRDFQRSLRSTAAQFAAAHAQGALATVGAIAHRLKSAARSVGAAPLAELCARLEAAGHEGNRDEIDALMPAFEHAVPILDAAVTRKLQSSDIEP